MDSISKTKLSSRTRILDMVVRDGVCCGGGGFGEDGGFAEIEWTSITNSGEAGGSSFLSPLSRVMELERGTGTSSEPIWLPGVSSLFLKDRKRKDSPPLSFAAPATMPTKVANKIQKRIEENIFIVVR